jgi:predicted ATPase
LLAQRCAQAGLVEKAVGYWLKAGQQSIARWARTEAITQLQNGLDLLSGLPEGAPRQEQELSLQVTLGHALVAAKGYAAPESEQAYVRARRLCEQLDRPPKLGILVGQFVFRLVRAELEQAAEHAEEIRRLAEVRNDQRWRCTGCSLSALVCRFLGNFKEARGHYDNALSPRDPMSRLMTASPDDLYAMSMVYLSRTLLCLGYIDQGRSQRDKALAEARNFSPYNLAHAQCTIWDGDWALYGAKSANAMLRSAEEVLAISREQGYPLLCSIGTIMRGWCLGAMGRAAKGIQQILEGIEIGRDTGTKLAMPFFLTTLAELYGLAAQPDEGLNCLAEAAELAETTQERWAEAEMHRLRGTLLLSTHRHAAAEDSYHRALAVARRQSAKLWELRAALDLARLWRDQSKRTEARDLLAPVYNWFTEGFDTPVLQDAKALLDQLV